MVDRANYKVESAESGEGVKPCIKTSRSQIAEVGVEWRVERGQRAFEKKMSICVPPACVVIYLLSGLPFAGLAIGSKIYLLLILANPKL